MLISRVPDEGGERGGDEARDLQTASQLFDLMAGDRDFGAGEDPLTASDLVLLYKNLDLGKQLMSSAGEMKPRSPNQHVETVVWRDEIESDSELSESYSSEQLEHVALVNQERLDLLAGSNTLCHKLGDLELRAGAAADYDRHFLFKDPYIKEQLKNLKLMSSTCEDSAVLPTSLLDYICCRRLEDNYNFYMDSVIRYVNNTIEQLKRISNGDYLTDKAKQKWRAVEKTKERGDESKVLTASTSIPLHVEQKLTGAASTWDDLVHSEVDLRSLAKILEKKIVVEVPKLISGSYKLFSSRKADNLVISCARAPAPAAARVDVVLQLQRSDAGRVVSNIDSIMILQTKRPTNQISNSVDLSCDRSTKFCQEVSNSITFSDGTELLPLTYPKTEDKTQEENSEIIKEESINIEEEIPRIIEIENPMIIEEEKRKPKIVELNETESFSAPELLPTETNRECRSQGNALNEISSTCEYSNSEAENMASLCESLAAPGQRAARIMRGEASVNLATPEDMRLTLQALDRQPSQPDNTTDDSFYSKTKKKSPTRVRIKSPYENKSHIIEERKRRRLLEVRERRERKKMAMNENKYSKNKIYKSAIAPQASSSVTKLSITNKSFYNSIFGQNFNGENKPLLNNAKGKKGQKKEDAIPEIVLEQPEDECDEAASVESDRGQKFINRSYYLDDTVTEMMYLQMKRASDGVKTSASTSAVSNDSGANQGSLSQLSSTSFANLETRPSKNKLSPEKDCAKDLMSHDSLQLVPSNTPKESPGEPAVGCRRSIEKIYVLMKKLGKIEPRKPRARSSGDGADPPPDMQSDSGTSLKHRLASSNPSTFSFGKPVNEPYPKDEPASPQSQELSSRAVVPKVIISSKQRPKPEPEKPIKVHRRAPQSPRVKAFPDNPLKAISQLLHEFDHVQKTRQKTAVESKQGKKEAVLTDARVARQEAARRRGRVEAPKEKPAERKPASPRTRRAEAAGAGAGAGEGRARAELADEARGEAVRGPPALSSRLHALAQPKRSYLQALDEPRYPRTQVPERAARTPAARPRARRGADVTSAPCVKPALAPLERGARGRRSAGSSPAPPALAAPPAAPDALKKKMVAVESYVQQHYGRGAGGAPDAGLPARAPLLPSDIELSSMTSSPMPEESSALGSRLHRLIASMLRSPRAPPTGAAARGDPPEQPPPTSSEPRGSVTELAMLENALSRKVSSGAFSARLRIKKLTLSPKHSLQRIVLLQSGDAASLLLESKLSQNFPSNPSRSSSNELDFKTLPLSATCLDWRFTQMPMQISTVGYAFPSYDRDSLAKAPPTKFVDINTIVTRKVLNESDEDSPSADRDTRDQTCQCFKGISSEQALERAVQAADADFAAPLDGSTPIDVNEHHPISENIAVDPKLDPPKTEMPDDKQPIPEVESLKENTETTKKLNSSEIVEEKSEMLDYTASLDMLVGLLNEIQKITSYSCESEEAASARPPPARRLAAAACVEARAKSCVAAVSSDLAAARKDTVDASTSETQLLSGGEGRACASKEVSAQWPAPHELVSVSTAVSRVHLHVSTEAASLMRVPPGPALSVASLVRVPPGPALSVASLVRVPPGRALSAASLVRVPPGPALSAASLVRVPPGPALSAASLVRVPPGSALSAASLAGYRTPCTVSTAEIDRHLPELPVAHATPGYVKSLVIFHDAHAAKVKNTEVTMICKNVVKKTVVRREKSASDKFITNIELVHNRPHRKNNVNKCCLNAVDFDPMIKMKRDILVTMYSFLVLTVFAALSLPELLLHT